MHSPIETVWTCDADGNWRQERRIRLRDGRGWREIRVIELDAAETASIFPRAAGAK